MTKERKACCVESCLNLAMSKGNGQYGKMCGKHHKNKYGFFRGSAFQRRTRSHREAKHAEQNGVCAICGKAEDTGANRRPISLCVDHDHATGELRGLLCRRCNILIGFAREDERVLAQSIAYLRKYKGAAASRLLPE